MRRPLQLRQCAAFHPTDFITCQISQTNLTPASAVSGLRLLKPGLFLQLALLALLAAFFPGARLHAQTGSITGTVVDPAGAAIPGAQVQIVNQATGDLARETTSDASGTFRALNVTAGTYRIKVSAPGMQGLSRD